MQSQTNRCVGLSWWMLLLLFCDVSAAAEPARVWNAIASRPYRLRGAERRLLDRAEQFVAQQQWEDALAALLRLLESDSSRLVALDEHRYTDLHEYCQRMLSRLPKPQLEEYRGLVDAAAESWYRQGIADRDPRLMERVVENYFCSSWADDALLAWGELALQRGEYEIARNAWRRLDKQFAEKADLLTYPDTDLSLAEVQARLMLVSVRAGEWERAERELVVLQRDYPAARGRLGGREVVFAEHLAELLKQAKHWPAAVGFSSLSTYGGNAQRTNRFFVLNWQPPLMPVWSHAFATTNRLAVFPLAVDDLVVFQDDSAVYALRLADGELAFTAEGDAFRSSVRKTQFLGWPRYTLTARESRVFGASTALLGLRGPPQDVSRDSSFWSIDTSRDGALSLRVSSDDPQVSFAGAPLVVGNRVFIVVRSNNQTARVGVDCYDLQTKERSWRRWLAQANSPATGWTNEWANHLLSYDAGMLFVGTNLGSLAAVHAHTGKVAWLRTYERHAAALDRERECDYYRGPSPPIVHRGRLLTLPTESQALQALDAATGEELWRVKVGDAAARLIAVTEEYVVVANGGLQVYNLTDGELVATKRVGKLAGQPVVFNDTVAWPIDGKIALVNLVDTNAEIMSVDFPQPGGANLVVAQDYLIAAGREQLLVYKLTP